jgi:hypothetical protein
MGTSETSSPFLPLPDDIVISSIHPTTTELVVSIACKKPYALCPRCGARSERMHGYYGRTVADLPCPRDAQRVVLFAEAASIARSMLRLLSSKGSETVFLD